MQAMIGHWIGGCLGLNSSGDGVKARCEAESQAQLGSAKYPASENMNSPHRHGVRGTSMEP